MKLNDFIIGIPKVGYQTKKVGEDPTEYFPVPEEVEERDAYMKAHPFFSFIHKIKENRKLKKLHKKFR